MVVDYFPIYDGMQESSSKINKLPHYGDDRDKIFQFDDDYTLVKMAKIHSTCRPEENIRFTGQVNLEPVNRYIAETVAREYPERFTFTDHGDKWFLEYKDGKPITDNMEELPDPERTFQQLAEVIQEDLIVVTDRGDGTDFVSAIYLSQPSDWGANHAIGKSFEEIHKNIPRIEKIIPNSNRLVRMMINSPYSFERIGAVNFRDGKYVRRHQDHATSVIFDPRNPELFLRYERQTTKGFPEINSFLLTVKAYFENCDNEDPRKRQAIVRAFEENNPKANAANFINKNRTAVLKWLNSK